MIHSFIYYILTPSSVKRNVLESPLLRLPRELRDLIWTFAFTRTIKPTRSELSQYSPFSVLVVCRQVYTEAVSAIYPLLVWSFGCMPNYEDFFWRLCDSARNMDRMSLIHSIQIGVDPSDLYMLAEVEDPGTDENEGKEEKDEYNRPTFRAFKNLSHLELLLAATGVFDDSDGDEAEEDSSNEHVQLYNHAYIEEAKDNFSKTMARKVPHVHVTYRDFGNSFAMKEF
jgi:hypothetical protein